VRAGMMAWLFINLSLFAKSYLAGSANLSVILYQFFCAWYIVDYFVHEEFMTSTWDIIAERLGFMLVFGDLVFIPFTFTIQVCIHIFLVLQLLSLTHVTVSVRITIHASYGYIFN
jgi:delta14-sterol reductase